MRIALAGDYPTEAGMVRGGVQAAFGYLAGALANCPGVDVHVVTMHKRPGLQPCSTLVGGVHVHYLRTFPRFEFARNFRTYQKWFDAKLAEIRPDVVHAQDTTDHGYAAVRCPYPTVITVHGIRREDSKYNRSVRVRARNLLYCLLIERYILNHTHYLIAISPYVTSYFSRQLRPDTEIHHIGNAIDPRYFERNLARTPNCAVLFAGRVIPRKRVEDLVYAFARVAATVPESELRIAGETESEPAYAESLRSTIASLRLQERVRFLGQLNENQVLDEFRNCAALVLPSAQETAPMVISQAQAAGKPVIATPVGGVPDMIRDGQTGFLTPLGDREALSRRLAEILLNPSLAAKVGGAGHRFAEASYRAESIALRTLKVYFRMKEQATAGAPRLQGIARWNAA